MAKICFELIWGYRLYLAYLLWIFLCFTAKMLVFNSERYLRSSWECYIIYTIHTMLPFKNSKKIAFQNTVGLWVSDEVLWSCSRLFQESWLKHAIPFFLILSLTPLHVFQPYYLPLSPVRGFGIISSTPPLLLPHYPLIIQHLNGPDL